MKRDCLEGSEGILLVKLLVVNIVQLVEDTLILYVELLDDWFNIACMVVYSLKFLSHTQNSYLTAFGVHEMHCQMHPNYCQTSILLVVDIY